MIAIACDANGSLYGWDAKFSGDSYLYKIDIETGEATTVGSLGMTLCYSQDGDFCKEDDILYLAAYTIAPSNGSYLYECDKQTGECNLVGQFGNNHYATILVIPYDYNPPVTTHTLDPPEPDGLNGWYVSDVNVTLNATDDMSGVNHTYYNVNSGEWKIYTEPFTISEDGEDILIEYYSVDNAGNHETYKQVSINMDQAPPVIDLTYEWSGTHSPYEFTFFTTANDETSGMERVEFYINGELEGTVYGPGPEYTLVKLLYFNITVKALICNLEISDDFVKFFAFIAFVKPTGPPYAFFSYAYDIAGNSAFDSLKSPFDSYGSRLYLLKRFTFEHGYEGYLGRYFIFADFVI